MNVQNLADSLNTLAAARGYQVRARANYGPEGTSEAIEYVDMQGNSVMTLTRGNVDGTGFAAAAERSLNGLGDNPAAAKTETFVDATGNRYADPVPVAPSVKRGYRLAQKDGAPIYFNGRTTFTTEPLKRGDFQSFTEVVRVALDDRATRLLGDAQRSLGYPLQWSPVVSEDGGSTWNAYQKTN